MPITIPDWQPLQTNFSSIPKLFIEAAKARAQEDSLRQNAETQRQFAENQGKKMSADSARLEWERKHKVEREGRSDEIATGNMLAPGSILMRAAAMPDADPNQLNTIGKPYGLSFDRETKQEPWPEYKDTVSGSDAAKFLLPKTFTAAPSTDDMHAAQPEQGPTPAGPSLAETPDAQQEQPLDVDAELASRAPPTTTRMMARTARGQSFALPSAPAPMDVGDNAANQVYAQVLARTGDEKQATAAALRVRGQNVTQEGQNTRSAQADATRRALGLTGEQRLGEGAANRGQSDINSRRAAWARLEAAKISAGAGGGQGSIPDPKIINAYYGQSNRAFARSGAKIDQSGMRLHDRMAAELADGMANPYKAQTFIHSAAASSVSTGSAAGRLTNMLKNDIEHALPLFQSAENMLSRKLLGHNTEEVQNLQLGLADMFRRVGHEQAKDDFRSWSASAGPNSIFGADPRTRGSTFDEAKSAAQALGLNEDEAMEILEQAQTAPQAPSTPQATLPHSRKPSAPRAPAPPPAAGPPPQQLPPEMHTPDGKVYKLGPDGKYR